MIENQFSAENALSGLKQFQRRTVDYVFDRLYGAGSTSRFLVADEVGLGKTLVAKGIIARIIDRLQHTVDRIDIIYVCSNAAIASQNINRLNVDNLSKFVLASRLTLLPLHLHNLTENKVNFISFTPKTTFDLKSSGGIALERALIFNILSVTDWDFKQGLFFMLQGAVQNQENWKHCIDRAASINNKLADNFRLRVSKNQELVGQLQECCQRYRSANSNRESEENKERYALIGKLRQMLAETCLEALEPDIVILDEFQRFKDLLDGSDDAANLAKALFNFPEVRTLLLSATPYKMLSLDFEQDDDHYPDFIRTLRFLFNDENAVVQLRQELQSYRKRLFTWSDGQHTGLEEARNLLQSRLLNVMCRTERVGMTDQLDAMIVEKQQSAPLSPEDLTHAALVDRAARAIGAHDCIEYWKSGPYLLNFLKHYDLFKKIDRLKDTPPDDLLGSLRNADGCILKKRLFERYRRIDPASARLRVLFEDTIDNGMWRLLWMPPSLPYIEPQGHYAAVSEVTKSLVFSSWNLVPEAIAALCSYEAERRMLKNWRKPLRHSEMHDQLKPILRFQIGRNNRPSGMQFLSLLLPYPTLATVIDPLTAAIEYGAGKPITRELIMKEAQAKCESIIKKLASTTASSNKSDKRWYWIAPALLERDTDFGRWLQSMNAATILERKQEPGANLQEHLQLLIEATQGKINLGPQPRDLPRVLAALALAAPGICAYRALRRVGPNLEAGNGDLLSAATSISAGFRTLFNLPETIALLRGSSNKPYWRIILRYSLDGNLQAMLDEQVHVLLEQLGLTKAEECKRVKEVSKCLADSLSIRTGQLNINEFKVKGKKIEQADFKTRCRFALKFGELRDDHDSTLARIDTVRMAFNSPFRPFILATTSIGQEGLDFHTWCHAIVHWNLPSNPVDLEQREGRVNRYKNHAVRKNIAQCLGLIRLRNWDRQGDPWQFLFDEARKEFSETSSDLVPYWVFEKGNAHIERRIPIIPFSKETYQIENLKKGLALYRIVFGQPRQQDLLSHLADTIKPEDIEKFVKTGRISLAPPEIREGWE